jgi:glutaredoxin
VRCVEETHVKPHHGVVISEQSFGRDVRHLFREILPIGESEMSSPSPQIVIYGASWCPDARRARRFFDEHGVAYGWIDIDEDNEASNFVRETNGGQIVIPVIVFPDKSILVEPSNYQLARKMEALLGPADPQS